MECICHFFGKAIANVINILDPGVIILGGGVGNIDLLYTDGVKSIENFIFNPRLATKILKPQLGDSAGVFGAALRSEEHTHELQSLMRNSYDVIGLQKHKIQTNYVL